MSGDVTDGLFRRGMLLKEQGRYPDAEQCFREAIGLNPEVAELYFHLAFCLFAQDNNKGALEVVEKALGLDPSDADSFSLKAFILSSLRRREEALKMADHAIGLNPFSSYAALARTFVLLQLERWSDAEAAARRALELDPDNVTASNFLAQSLRLQNKMEQNAEQIAYSLSKAPDDDDTHATAGWSALQRGNRQVAETHFLESLRLNPNNEIGREGLLQSYRARSPLYRVYLNYCFWMQRLNEKARWAVIIGLVVFIKLSPVIFVGSLKILYFPVLMTYLVFCLWVHVTGGVGNLILLTDRAIRRVLKKTEIAEGLLVGGGVIVGLPLMIISTMVKVPALVPFSAMLVGLAFPLSYTITNPNKAGRFLFGGIAAFVAFAGTVCVLYELGMISPQGKFITQLATAGVLAVVATTWLANVPSLRRHD